MKLKTQARLLLTMTREELIMEMARGPGGFNPGALRVATEIMSRGRSIDPHNAFDGFGPLIHLDEWGVHGAELWRLYSLVCGNSLGVLCGLVRCVQMGILSEEEFQTLLLEGAQVKKSNEMFGKLKEKLPKFNIDG